MPWSASDDQAEAPPFVLLTDDVLSSASKGNWSLKSVTISPENFALYVLECLWAVIEEKLEPDSFPAAVKAPDVPGPHSKTICHALWLVWADIEGPNADAFTEDPASGACDATLGTPQAARIVSVLQESRRHGLLDDTDLFEVLDMRLLVQSGLSAPSNVATSFSKKVTIARNARTIKITLFNTFREELEGYAKLVTLLNNPALTREDQMKKICCEIDQLAGYYRLNPIKVCTCVLTAMERSPAVAKILVHVPHVIPIWCMESLNRRFKFSNTAGSGGLPKSLFTAIAVLLKAKKLRLRDVLSLMTSDFDALPQSKDSIKPLVATMDAAGKPPSKGLYSEQIDLDVTARDTALTEALGDPAPIKLAQALLAHGEWLQACAVLTHSPFNLLAHRGVCGTLLQKLLALLKNVPQSGVAADVAARLSKVKGGSNSKKLLADKKLPEGSDCMDTDEFTPQFTPLMMQMLDVLGPLCFRRPDVVTRVWRLASHILSAPNAPSDATAAALHAVRHAALPASCFMAPGAAVWLEAQMCLMNIPQLQRCEMYGAVQTVFRHAPVDTAAAECLPAPALMHELFRGHAVVVDRVLGALAKKTRLPDGTPERDQDARYNSRIFQKVFMAHPFAASQRMVELCRMYDSHAPLLLYYSSSLLPLLQEIVLFEIIRFLLLSELKPRTGSDQAFPADWFNNLVSFLGRLVAQSPTLEPYAVFAYLSQSLRYEGPALEVMLAGAIFDNSLSSVPHQLDHDQCAAFFFGSVYRCHKLTIDFLDADAVNARSQRFVKSLGGEVAKGPSLLIACFVQLCQQRMKVCMTPDMQIENNVRAMFEATQRTHAVVLHYIRLLTSMELKDLVHALPGLPKLIKNCQIGPECAMAVYRPILRTLYKLNVSTEDVDSLLKEKNISLETLVEDLKQCIPKLSADAKYAFDPSFYILFWALELPDLAEDTEQRYMDLKRELLAKLDSEKRGLREMSQSEARSRAKMPSRGVADEPIVNQGDMERKNRKVKDTQNMLQLLDSESAACIAQSTTAIEVLKGHLDKCIPSVHGQHALSNAFMQETEYMSVFLKEVFMLLETTCTEEWLGKHPVIGQQTKHLTLVEWEKLQRKFQKRTCSTLTTFLLDESSDEVLQRNVLKLMLNLLPICPKREDDQKSVLAALETMMAKTNITESVMMMLGSAKRNITRMREDAQKPAGGNVDTDLAEDGEVPDVPESGQAPPHSSGGGMGGGGGTQKRARDTSLDGHHHRGGGRPRVDTSMIGRSGMFNHSSSNRQFGGTRGT